MSQLWIFVEEKEKEDKEKDSTPCPDTSPSHQSTETHFRKSLSKIIMLDYFEQQQRSLNHSKLNPTPPITHMRLSRPQRLNPDPESVRLLHQRIIQGQNRSIPFAKIVQRQKRKHRAKKGNRSVFLVLDQPHPSQPMSTTNK